MEPFPIFAALKARASLPHTGQFPMSHYQGLRKELVEFPKQFRQPRFLFGSTGIGRHTVRIQSAFIADTDAATVAGHRL